MRTHKSKQVKTILKAISFCILFTGCGIKLPAIATTTSNTTAITPTAPTTNIGGTQVATSLDPAHEILMLGDSVALGYEPAVTSLLSPLNYTVDIVSNTENSYYLNENLNTYLAQYPNADIVTFNAGIWDTIVNSVYFGIVPDAANVSQYYNSTDDQYRANLISIAQKLVATNKRIIFVLSTDCLPNTQEDVTRIAGLNAIALQVLPPLGIQVVDVHTLSLQLTNHHLGTNHFDAAGNALLAGLISSAILTQ